MCEGNSNNLAGLVSRLSSLYIKSYGALATPSFRGTTSSHTLVLWNGIPINSNANGLADFSSIYPFNFSNIKASNPITNGANALKLENEIINTNYDQLVFGSDEEKLDYKLSNCCNPLPGEKVFGFLTVNDGIKVHRTDCKNAVSLRSNFSYRILSAKWIDSTQHEFRSTIQIIGIDNIGVLNKITTYYLNITIVLSEKYFMGVYTKPIKKLFWCRWPESNRHSFRHCPLKTACLPIPPHRQVQIN